MSHKKGKIEVLGYEGNTVFLKYHQAKEMENVGRVFVKELDEYTCWLEE